MKIRYMPYKTCLEYKTTVLITPKKTKDKFCNLTGNIGKLLNHDIYSNIFYNTITNNKYK